MNTLTEIGKRYQCDKFTVHEFGEVYERHFSVFRDRPIKILELGIGGENLETGGASLKVWEEYFPHAAITAIDIYDKSSLDTDRIKTIVCDQSDQSALASISAEYGPFDLVIDDASHEAQPTLRSLFTLFHLLQPGGFYVIEDLQTSYWPHYGGTSIIDGAIETPVSWIKRMVDVINQPEILWPRHPAIKSGFQADELHVYHNIAFIRRSIAQKQSSVLNDSRRDEWFKLDIESQTISEAVAEQYADSAELRLRLMRLLSALK